MVEESSVNYQHVSGMKLPTVQLRMTNVLDSGI